MAVCAVFNLLTSCRREALSVWKDKQGLEATYGNLLELFETAGQSRCAEVVCQVLRKKQFPSGGKSFHRTPLTLFDVRIVIACCVIIIAIVIAFLYM